jgi:hypothetical protein
MPGSFALAIAVGALVVAGCTPDLCTRNSECPTGYACSSRAQCERLPDAATAASDDAGGGGGPDSGSSPILDAAVEFDAGPDAAVDVDAALGEVDTTKAFPRIELRK